jgi:hypothetical protein
MALYPSLFGQVDLPDETDDRHPLGRPTGVRTVRRPTPRAGGRPQG